MPGVSGKKFFRRIRPWQWIKHSIFTQYLWVWAMKVGSPPQAKTIWVIDAFAGAGEFKDDETGETAEGSPLRAALVAKKYNELDRKVAEGKQLKLICIERDRDNAARLAERLAGFDFATVMPGEFGEHADEIASMIGDDPALVLLDPIGVKSIDAKMCKKLLHRAGKTDAFVNVQFAVVHRTRGQLLPNGEPNPEIPGSSALVQNIDDFFGTEDWRAIATNGKPFREQEQEYLQLYFDSVVGPRFRCKNAYPVKRRFGGTTKYYLVHIADHPDADWLINDLLASVESRQFMASRAEATPGALPGFVEHDESERVALLRKKLGAAMVACLDAAPEKSMTFDSLRVAVRGEYFGTLKEGEYSKVVKQLLTDGRISREREGVRARLELSEKITLVG
jgi:three-Cys-motif partner protein